MPKELIVTALGNRIEYATTNGKGLITGKREDITDNAINAVATHFMKSFNEKNPNGKGFGINFGEHGSLMYLRPGTKVIWEEEEDENDWIVNGVDYWNNPKCPRSYLEQAAVRLVFDVESEVLPADYFKDHDESFLRKKIGFYEDAVDK